MLNEFKKAIQAKDEATADQIYQANKKELIKTQPLLVLEYYITFNKPIDAEDGNFFYWNLNSKHLTKEVLDLFLRYFKVRIREPLEVFLLWNKDLFNFYTDRVGKYIGAGDKQAIESMYRLLPKKEEFDLRNSIMASNYNSAKRIWDKYTINDPNIGVSYFLIVPQDKLADELNDDQLESLIEAYKHGIIPESSFKDLYNYISNVPTLKSKADKLLKEVVVERPQPLESANIPVSETPVLRGDFYVAAEKGDESLSRMIVDELMTEPNPALEDLILSYRYPTSALQYLHDIKTDKYNKDLIKLVIEEGSIEQIIYLLNINDDIKAIALQFEPLIRGRLVDYPEEDINKILKPSDPYEEARATIELMVENAPRIPHLEKLILKSNSPQLAADYLVKVQEDIPELINLFLKGDMNTLVSIKRNRALVDLILRKYSKEYQSAVEREKPGAWDFVKKYLYWTEEEESEPEKATEYYRKMPNLQDKIITYINKLGDSFPRDLKIEWYILQAKVPSLAIEYLIHVKDKDIPELITLALKGDAEEIDSIKNNKELMDLILKNYPKDYQSAIERISKPKGLKPHTPSPSAPVPSAPSAPIPSAKPYEGLAGVEQEIEEYLKSTKPVEDRPFGLNIPKKDLKKETNRRLNALKVRIGSLKLAADELAEGETDELEIADEPLPSETEGMSLEDVEKAAKIPVEEYRRYPKEFKESLSELYRLKLDDPELETKLREVVEHSNYRPEIILKAAVLLKKRLPEYEKYLIADYDDIPTALNYIVILLKDRFPVLEEWLYKAIQSEHKDAIYYLRTYLTYLKQFGKSEEFINELKTKYKLSTLTRIDIVQLKMNIMKALDRNDQAAIDEILISTEHPELILFYAAISGKPLAPEYESILAKYPVFSLYYAKTVLNDRFPAGEPTLITRATTDSISRGYFMEYLDFLKKINKYKDFLVDNSELREKIEEAQALSKESVIRYAQLGPSDIDELVTQAVNSKDPTKIQDAFNAILSGYKEDKISEVDYIRYHLKLYSALHPDSHNDTIAPLISSLVHLSLDYLFLLYYYIIYTHNRFPDETIERKLFQDLDSLEVYAKALASVAGMDDMSAFAFKYRPELITIKNYYEDYINKYDAIPLLISLVK